jgi:uncharacterized membrane protein YvlD (DUF360 family)
MRQVFSELVRLPVRLCHPVRDMTELLIKLAVRFGVFLLVFAFAAWKMPKVRIHPKFALPLVALVFAVLNVGLYWLLKPVLNLATLGAAWLFIPFVLNGTFLWATQKLLRPLRIEGFFTTLKLAVILTAAHGACWVVLDKWIFP